MPTYHGAPVPCQDPVAGLGKHHRDLVPTFLGNLGIVHVVAQRVRLVGYQSTEEPVRVTTYPELHYSTIEYTGKPFKYKSPVSVQIHAYFEPVEPNPPLSSPSMAPSTNTTFG